MATILHAANPMSETASLHTIKTEHDLQPVRTGGCNKPITAVVHALGRLRLAAIVQPSCGTIPVPRRIAKQKAPITTRPCPVPLPEMEGAGRRHCDLSFPCAAASDSSRVQPTGLASPNLFSGQ
jgi:hypothetical protein